METDHHHHHHHQEEQGPGGSELGGGGDGGSATPADERGSAGGAGSGGVGVEDSIDGGCYLVLCFFWDKVCVCGVVCGGRDQRFLGGGGSRFCLSWCISFLAYIPH